MEKIISENTENKTKAILCVVLTPDKDEREVAVSLGELERLLETAGGELFAQVVQARQNPDNATYLGKGKIEEIGLRPGEKLYEELLIKTETLTKTENDMIFIERDASLTRAEVDEKIQVLSKAVQENENEIASDKIKEALMAVVPTFHSPSSVNQKADQSEEMKKVDRAQKQELSAK